MSTSEEQTVLALNGGSSSVKFALFSCADLTQRRLHGRIERIGLPGTTLTATVAGRRPTLTKKVPKGSFAAAVDALLDWLESRREFATVIAIGHRVVHGMQRTAPERVTRAVLHELRALIPFDPEHLPAQIRLMEKLLQRFPKLPQVACFDTAFHRTMPRVATQLPIPRRYEALGVQRYGFHGLSYAYLMQELLKLGDPAAPRGARDPGAPGQRRKPRRGARRRQRGHDHGLHAGFGSAHEHAQR